MSDPFTPTRHTALQTLSPSKSEEHIAGKSSLLSRMIRPEDDDETIRELMPSLWHCVNNALKMDPEISRPPAEYLEFDENVKKRGEDTFIRSLKNMASQSGDIVASQSGDILTSQSCPWMGLLHDDVFFKTKSPEAEALNGSQAGSEATVHAWSLEYKGNAATALFKTISDCLSLLDEPYSRSTCIINSSGTGKSRMVDEVSMYIITVPMCFRAEGSHGFPPVDVGLRNLLFNIQDTSTRKDAGPKVHGFVYALLTIAREELAVLEHGITISPEEQTVEWVTKRQRQLACAFREAMTKGQSFKHVNAYRERFYKKVIRLAGKFVDHCHFHKPTSSPPRFVGKDGNGVREAGDALVRFVDQHRLLNSRTGPRRPLVILSFDESDFLTKGSSDENWTLFSELCRTLRSLVKLPLFSLFLSTAGRFQAFSPDIRSNYSSRIRNLDAHPLDPITEVSFDCLAPLAKEGKVMLKRVVGMKWISHLGRPLFGSHFDQFDGLAMDRDDEILNFAKQKLLGGRTKLDDSGILACLATRFALEFNEDQESRDLSCKQIERHMRLCLAATAGFEKLVTYSASEPLLAEAALDILRSSNKNPVRHLANHANLYCIDRGRRGELVAALIIMQARDASLLQTPTSRRWVSIAEFMQALLPQSAYDILIKSKPTFWRKGQNILFDDTFKYYCLWFNHIIKVEDSNVIQAEFLWRYITRGAMIICKDNQYGVDIVLPVCHRKHRLSRRTVTAIYIQVKKAEAYNLRINNTLFDAMDPLVLGLHSVESLPIIRMVFALGSSQAGVRFPTLRKRAPRHAGDGDKFTSFDVWCAGLSQHTYQQIGNDLHSYRVLLDRSLQPHDVFELKETNYRYLSDDTKIERGSLRRAMAPLAMSHHSHGHDRTHQPNSGQESAPDQESTKSIGAVRAEKLLRTRKSHQIKKSVRPKKTRWTLRRTKK